MTDTVTSKQVVVLYNYIEQEGLVDRNKIAKCDSVALKWLIKSEYIAELDDLLFVDKLIPD